MVRRRLPYLDAEYILVRTAFAAAVAAALTAFFSFPLGFFPIDFFVASLGPLLAATALIGFRKNLWWRDLLVSCLLPIPMGAVLGWWIVLTASVVGYDGWGAEECAGLAVLDAWKPLLLGLLVGTAPLAFAAHLFRKGFSSEIRAVVLLAAITAGLATTVAVAFPPIVTSQHRGALEPGATRRWAWYIPRRVDYKQDGTGNIQLAKDRTFVRVFAGGTAAFALLIGAVAVVRGRRRARALEAGRGVVTAGGPNATGARPFANASEFAGSGVARDGGPNATGASTPPSLAHARIADFDAVEEAEGDPASVGDARKFESN